MRAFRDEVGLCLFLGQVENYRENTIYGFFKTRKHNI